MAWPHPQRRLCQPKGASLLASSDAGTPGPSVQAEGGQQAAQAWGPTSHPVAPPCTWPSAGMQGPTW